MTDHSSQQSGHSDHQTSNKIVNFEYNSNYYGQVSKLAEGSKFVDKKPQYLKNEVGTQIASTSYYDKNRHLKSTISRNTTSLQFPRKYKKLSKQGN
jgi:hypothetical protein